MKDINDSIDCFSINTLQAPVELNKSLLEIIYHSGAALVYTSVEGEIIWCNSLFEQLSGFQLKNLFQKNIKTFYYEAETYREQSKFWATVQNGEISKGKIKIRLFGDSGLERDVSILPNINHKGEMTGLIWHMKAVPLKEEIHFAKELEMAKQVQRSVLSEPLYQDNISVEATYVPCESLAGDMYAWFQISDYQYGIILLDIMGHGISSALISMSIRSLLRGMIIRIVDPVLVMQELNKHMHHLFQGADKSINSHLTAIYLLIDTHKKEIQYVNAGHPPAYVIESGTVTSLDTGTIMIGAFPSIPIEKGELHYDQAAKIVLYTDGLMDALHPSPIQSLKMIQHSLREHEHDKNNTLISKITQSCNRSLSSNDDICIIAVSL
ncbi:SpoIIE family protein phosphatase [Bacillus tianshenii]|nr:SpoIIE family protein phosphatase [Bacillus tianshenii]